MVLKDRPPEPDQSRQNNNNCIYTLLLLVLYRDLICRTRTSDFVRIGRIRRDDIESPPDYPDAATKHISEIVSNDAVRIQLKIVILRRCDGVPYDLAPNV